MISFLSNYYHGFWCTLKLDIIANLQPLPYHVAWPYLSGWDIIFYLCFK